MDAASQQKILGYFIEEAKEHLETLEQGILELSSVVEDAERVNELFRAAHSVKGGAAMLGYTSIQKTAHRLEDAFKILKENSFEVDQKLESLFLKGYDVLHDLIERLQSTFGLREDEAEEIVQNSEANFQELQAYLYQLVGGESVATPQPEPQIVSKPVTPNITEEVTNILKQMLQLFKQQATVENRQQLQQLCVNLAKLHQNQQWQTLLKTVHKAIANPQHSYRTLAPVVIKEIKGASDLISNNQAEQITISESLKHLAASKTPQILITIEPKAAADVLLKAFNKQQLSQLVQLLGTRS